MPSPYVGSYAGGGQRRLRQSSRQDGRLFQQNERLEHNYFTYSAYIITYYIPRIIQHNKITLNHTLGVYSDM